MMRPVAVVLMCSLITSTLFAGQVPGTSVALTPPEGFVAADRFSGFMQQATGSSIVVSEIPGPFGEVTAGFSDQQRMQAQGMKLLSRSSARVDGHEAILLHVEQFAYGTLFKKWLVAVDRAGATVLIVATYPQGEDQKNGESLRAAVLAATFEDSTDPIDALLFTAKPMAPFQVARVLGQNMILSPDGRFPVQDEKVPFIILGLSASEKPVVSDRKAFAERRITKTATVKTISVDESTPVQIGGLSGYRTTANGEGADAGTPLSIYQVVLFDASGYCVIQGVTPSSKQSTYMPIFEKIARTFRLKEPHDY